MSTANIQEPCRRPPHASRWLGLGAISLLLHLFALDWAGSLIEMPAMPDRENPAITATIITPAPTKPAVTKTVQPKKSAPRKVVQRMQPVAVVNENHSLTTATAVVEIDSPAAIGIASSLDSEIAPPAFGSTDSASTETESTAIRYKTDPPPSAELKYDVTKISASDNPVYGSGSINWRSNGSSYSIVGEAGILFITALNFKSEGSIDDSGIAPLLYSEKRFRKSATNTHFQREPKIISFSASTRSYPRKGGEQDRASIIWQLAAIGRGDSEKFSQHTAFDIFVAGVRDGEIWQLRVLGEKEIELTTGKVKVWHVVRTPRPGSYDQTLDIWLSPQQEWYPVKLRYTEANGDYLDLSLSGIYPAIAR